MNAMTKPILSAAVLGLVLALGSTAFTVPVLAAAKTEKPAPPSVSKAMIKPLKAVQESITAKRWDEALARLKEAEATPGQTPFDTFAMNQFLSYTHLQLAQPELAIPAFQAQVDSGFLSPEDNDRITRGIAQLYYQVKDYPKAAAAGTKIITAGKADDEMFTLVAQAEYLQKNYAAVPVVLKPFIAAQESQGKVPKETTLALLSDSYLRLKDTPASIGAMELMVKYYPKPENWSNLLSLVRGDTSTDIVLYNVYRLMGDTGTLTNGNDIIETAQLAIKFGLPGEAAAVLQRGVTANAFTSAAEKAAAERQLQSARGLAEADRASLVKFEAEAKAAKSGEGDVRLGQALLSYEQYEKALEALQRGIAKGSLRNADEAQILLGITLLRLNRKADAVAAFSATKGTDQKLAGLGHLWAVHAAH
jgi:tetratricopeptide (TPR) repeat protein